jgi:ParB/RepB/Spo0J family partition protein
LRIEAINMTTKPNRHQVIQIAMSGIAVAERLRTIRPDTVDALAQSMTDQGQLQPIIVRSRKDGGYWLVAGLHRLEAAKKLEWTEINCTVFGEMEADEAELAEIDENLVRADLSPAERALHIGKRKALHEKVHGKAKANSACAANKKMGRDVNAKSAVTFTKKTAKKTRQSERKVQLEAHRAEKVVVLADIVGTSLDKGAEIDALAKLPVEKQRSLAEAAKRGEKVSAVRARKACGPEAPKTSDGTGNARSTPSRRKKADLAPTLDPRAWSMSTASERAAFVETVGRSEIEDALNAIESGCKLTRGLNSLNQAWKAATEPELRTFCRQNYDEMNRLGWHQKW